MCVIGSDFMQLSLEVVGKLKEEKIIEQNKTKKIKKITRYPDTEDLEPLNDHKFSKTLMKEEVSPLGKELSLFDRPNEVERGKILEAHRLEPILQQQISQRMAPSSHDGRKAHLLEDKQIPSVGVFDELETASQITRDAVTTHTKTASQDLMTASEWWNDAFIPDEVSLNYKNLNIEQLLGIMERKVNTLMKDAISLMGESESIFRLTTNEMYRPPSEPSRQEEFEHIVMNFILDQEERVRQLEDYMRAIAEEFMEFSLKVARRRKERIKENENKPRKIKKITKG
ncbi:hypothetical protein Tco_0083983 [Tanacetum coccineum]